ASALILIPYADNVNRRGPRATARLTPPPIGHWIAAHRIAELQRTTENWSWTSSRCRRATRRSRSPRGPAARARPRWRRPTAARLEGRGPTRPAALRRRMPLAMSSFPLVPYSGRIRDGRFSFQGRNVVLPLNFLPESNSIHGQAWQVPWQVVHHDKELAALEY